MAGHLASLGCILKICLTSVQILKAEASYIAIQYVYVCVYAKSAHTYANPRVVAISAKAWLASLCACVKYRETETLLVHGNIASSTCIYVPAVPRMYTAYTGIAVRK